MVYFKPISHLETQNMLLKSYLYLADVELSIKDLTLYINVKANGNNKLILGALESAYHYAIIDLEEAIKKYKYYNEGGDFKALVSVQKLTRSSNPKDVRRFFVFVASLKGSTKRGTQQYVALCFEDESKTKDYKVIMYIPEELFKNYEYVKKVKVYVNIDVPDGKYSKLHNYMCYTRNAFASIIPHAVLARIPILFEFPALLKSNIGTVVSIKVRCGWRKYDKEVSLLSDVIASSSNKLSSLGLAPSYSLPLSQLYGMELKLENVIRSLTNLFEVLAASSVNILQDKDLINNVLDDIKEEVLRPLGRENQIDKHRISKHINEINNEIYRKSKGKVNVAVPNDLDPKAVFKALASNSIYGPSSWREIETDFYVYTLRLLRITMVNLFGGHTLLHADTPNRIVLTEYYNRKDSFIHNSLFTATVYGLMKKNLSKKNISDTEVLVASYILSDIIRGWGTPGRLHKRTKTLAWNAVELGLHGIAHAVSLMSEGVTRSEIYDFIILNKITKCKNEPRSNDWIDGGILKVCNLGDNAYIFLGFKDEVDIDLTREELLSTINTKIKECYERELERMVKVRRALNLNITGKVNEVADLLKSISVPENARSWEDVQRSLSLPPRDAKTLAEFLCETKRCMDQSSILGEIIEAYVPMHFDVCPHCLLNNAVSCMIPTLSQRYWRISLFWAKYILENLEDNDFIVKDVKRYTE